ncbi:MAG: sodium/pantothenate symporter [Anaerovoracaceae bacterium]
MSGKQAGVLAILLAYMALNLVVGIWMSKQGEKKSGKGGFLQNYFIGGRSMGGFVLAMTLIATYTSASSFLGGPGLASDWGLTQSWVAAIQIGTAFITLGVVGKKLAVVSRRINAVTVTEYLRARYNSPAIVITCSVALLVFFAAQMVAQFMGGATLIQVATGMPYIWGLVLFAAVVIIYTSIGGFRAVVITDTIQGLVMTIGTFLFLFFVIRAGGGLGHIETALDASNPGWNLLGMGDNGKTVLALSPGYLISFWVLVGVGVIGLPQTAVRSMGFKDTQSLHRALIYGTVTVGILMIGMHFAGTLTVPLVEGANLESTDQVIPYVVMKYMPTWAAGLFLAAPLAAVMSTVDSLMILASATIIKDLYMNYIVKKDYRDAPRDEKAYVSETAEEEKKQQKKLSRASVLLTVAIGLIVFLCAIKPPSILVWVNLFAMGGLEATFFWPLVGGLFYRKGTAAACLSSTVVGIAVFLFFNLNKIAPFHIHEIVLGLIAGGLTYFIVSKVQNKEPDPEMLKICF